MAAINVTDFLKNARDGYCGTTIENAAGECANGAIGNFNTNLKMEHYSVQQLAAECMALCAQCEQCEFVSMSALNRDCSWFAECELQELYTAVGGFISGAAKLRREASPQPWAPSALELSGAELACDVTVSLARSSNCPSSHWHAALAPLLHTRHMVYVNVGANKGYNVMEFLGRFHSGWSVNASTWQRHQAVDCGQCAACTSVTHPAHLQPRSVFVVAVELLQQNFEQLRRGFRYFGVPGVAVHAAVDDTDGVAYEPRGAALGDEDIGLVPHGKHDSMQHAPVRAVTVTTLASILGLREIHILSVDTEGNDALVLAGAEPLLRRRRVHVIEFEFSNRGAWKRLRLNDTVSELSAMGYSCFWQSRWGRLAAYQPHCAYGVISWGNLLCSHVPNIVSVMRSWQGLGERTMERT